MTEEKRFFALKFWQILGTTILTNIHLFFCFYIFLFVEDFSALIGNRDKDFFNLLVFVLIYHIFISNPLKVGLKRGFIFGDKKIYSCVFESFEKKNYKNIVPLMLLSDFLFLFSFIPFFRHIFRFIPDVLAKNMKIKLIPMLKELKKRRRNKFGVCLKLDLFALISLALTLLFFPLFSFIALSIYYQKNSYIFLS